DLVDPVHPITRPQLDAKRHLFYRADIEAADTDLGRLLERIQPRLADTMVIVIGDNGTESSVVDETRYDRYRAKRTVYQLGGRVPRMVGGPRVAGRGRLCDHVVGAVDLWRTLRDLAGAHEPPGLIPPNTTIDSVSFLPLILSPDAPPTRPYILAETFNPNG